MCVRFVKLGNLTSIIGNDSFLSIWDICSYQDGFGEWLFLDLYEDSWEFSSNN